MKWIEFSERKPPISDAYYWKGKNLWGGKAFYNAKKGEFEFDDDIPVNKVSAEHLLWLDENAKTGLETLQAVVFEALSMDGGHGGGGQALDISDKGVGILIMPPERDFII